jgi:hypothetical protein
MRMSESSRSVVVADGTSSIASEQEMDASISSIARAAFHHQFLVSVRARSQQDDAADGEPGEGGEEATTYSAIEIGKVAAQQYQERASATLRLTRLGRSQGESDTETHARPAACTMEVSLGDDGYTGTCTMRSCLSGDTRPYGILCILQPPKAVRYNPIKK